MTHDLGRLYLTTLTYPPEAPIPLFVESSWAVETDAPHRYGRGIAVRLPFSRRAIVVGWWGGDAHDEDAALNRAMSGSGWRNAREIQPEWFTDEVEA